MSSADMLKWRKERLTTALVVIKESIPSKILALKALINATDTTGWSSLEQYEFIKTKLNPTLVDFVCITDIIIAFLREQEPQQDDGHNSGVQTLHTILQAIIDMQGKIDGLHGQVPMVFASSAEYASKAKKHPECKDYVYAYYLTVEKRNPLILVNLCMVRDYYFFIHDLLMKNLDVLLEPRKAPTTQAMF